MLNAGNCERSGERGLLPRRQAGPLARDRVAARIVDLVGTARGVTPAEILSHRRCSNEVALARHLAMYLVHTLLRRQYKEVGILFGRDRTTVAYACARTEDRREDRSRFERDVVAIEAILAREADRAAR
ncbi:MAG: chromosomal replication initiator DnaA [Hyphomicrobiales bacterium]|nr:MAG: chromosomal replication initiator DnaA [Hyphomicrobiales bacterium]